jgi:Flavodoxin reductases (ferredoxin-NADPH reductases) family 1
MGTLATPDVVVPSRNVVVPTRPAPRPGLARPGLEPNATLSARVDLTDSIARFVVRPDDGVGTFEPGQYFALGLTVDGKPLLRPYSTSSLRGTRHELEFLIRLVAEGAFTPRLWALEVGARLRIGRAKGLFTLDPGDPRTHLFVATGTGLAPCLSMLESLVQADAESGLGGGGEATTGGTGGASTGSPRAVLVHGVSRADELAYRDRLERLSSLRSGVRYVPVVSRPTHPASAGWAGMTGRLDAGLGDICDMHELDPARSVAYICGNPEMITAAREILTGVGFAPEAVVSEQYWAVA